MLLDGTRRLERGVRLRLQREQFRQHRARRPRTLLPRRCQRSAESRELRLPSRLAQFQEKARRSMQWIWGLAFGLAATGAYALYTGYVQPWQQQLEQAGFGGSNLLNLLIFQSTFWKGWQSMITLLEILALATVGGLGVMFLRRRIRRGSALALVFAGLCAALMVPAPASAMEFRHEERLTIGKDEVIHSDLYAAGGRVRVEGTIEGDYD